MIRPWLVGVFTALLALQLSGCGVDGEPTPPPPKPKNEPGIRVSGQARVGVSVSRNATSMWSLETEFLTPGSE